MNAWTAGLPPHFVAGALLCAQVASAQPTAPTNSVAEPNAPDGSQPAPVAATESPPPTPPSQVPPVTNVNAAPTSPERSVSQAVANAAPPRDGDLSQAASGMAIERLVGQHGDWACTYESHALTERHVVVGCQEGAVLTLARTPTGVQLIARRATPGRVDGFYEQDGAVWMRVVQENAERLVPGTILDSAGGPAVAPKASMQDGGNTASGRDEYPSGTVVAVHDRDVVVAVPHGHGVEVGARMSLSLVTEDAFIAPDPVVARVTRVMPNQLLLRLGVNEVVGVGYRAEVTEDAATASRRNAPRVHGVWEIRAVLRPMLNIGSVGGGVATELGLAKRGEYFRYGVEFAPLALAGATGQNTLFSGGGYVFGAVDHQVYSAGVGVGVNTVNDTDFQSESGSGLTIVQLLRIGAVDGMHLSSRVEAVVFRDEVLFSFLRLQGQVGVADSSWLIVRGGGGSMGYGFGEVVVRNLLWGNGHAGSTFMELGLGGAGLFKQTCSDPAAVLSFDSELGCRERDVSGPTFTAGLEWRL